MPPGESPVYVRNENESIPADAARLQALLSIRQVATQASLSVADIEHTRCFLNFCIETLLIAIRGGSQMRLIPKERPPVRLDLAIEQELRLCVRRSYPEIADNLRDPSPQLGASLTEFRLRDCFQSSYREILRDYDALPGYLLCDQTSQARFSILFELLKKIAAV